MEMLCAKLVSYFVVAERQRQPAGA